MIVVLGRPGLTADGHLARSAGRIALAAAAPGLLFSPRRFEILKKSDWSTLAFFAAMFVTSAITASASATRGWQCGWFSGAGFWMHHAQCSISSV